MGRPRKEKRPAPVYLFQMKPPAGGVEIVSIDSETLIHCADRHMQACLKALRDIEMQWIASQLFAGFSTNRFYRDKQRLRELFRVPVGAPAPRRADVDDDGAPFLENGCSNPWDHNNPHFYLWTLAWIAERRDARDAPPLLPIGRFV
jgi:hypothetical protein